MRLELNYDCKTITVKDQVNLKDFIKEVKKLGLDLKEWSVVSETQLTWTTYPYYQQPYYQQPNDWQIICSDGTNIEVDNTHCLTTNDVSSNSANINHPLNSLFSYTD